MDDVLGGNASDTMATRKQDWSSRCRQHWQAKYVQGANQCRCDRLLCECKRCTTKTCFGLANPDINCGVQVGATSMESGPNPGTEQTCFNATSYKETVRRRGRRSKPTSAESGGSERGTQKRPSSRHKTRARHPKLHTIVRNLGQHLYALQRPTTRPVPSTTMSLQYRNRSHVHRATVAATLRLEAKTSARSPSGRCSPRVRQFARSTMPRVGKVGLQTSYSSKSCAPRLHTRAHGGNA